MLNFALVGCGKIAKRHSNLLGKNQIAGANLVAVCDINEKSAASIASEFSIPYFLNMHEMMKSKKINIDVVVVLTASGNHAKDVIALAKYGKDIIVEKPMALSLSDADKMIKECEKAKVKLFVVKQNRFNIPIIKLRKAIESGRFGKLILGTVRIRWCREQEYYDQNPWRGTWLMDGGVLTNQASHHIDLLEWMFGEVESVFAYSSTALAKIQAEDTAVVSLKFKNGALGIIEATTATRPTDLEGSLSILGEKGSVVIGGFAANRMETWNFSEKLQEDEQMLEKFSINPPNNYGYGHKAYYDDVVDCISNNRTQLIDGYEGRKSIELINAIYESIETGLEFKIGSKQKYSKLGVDV